MVYRSYLRGSGPWETPTEWIVWVDGCNSTAQSSGLNVQSSPQEVVGEMLEELDLEFEEQQAVLVASARSLTDVSEEGPEQPAVGRLQRQDDPSDSAPVLLPLR